MVIGLLGHFNLTASLIGCQTLCHLYLCLSKLADDQLWGVGLAGH